MNVGFVGIGRMGEAMVLRLLSGGFPVTVWNRSPQKLHKVIDAGAVRAETLSALARDSNIVLSIVTNDEAVEQIYLAANGLLHGQVEGKLFADMSTILPGTVRRVSERAATAGASFVDAPVAGTVQPAREGRLLILTGGEPKDVERLQPVFNVLGRRTEYLGAVGSGAAMKLTHNALLATHWAGLAESMAIGSRYGLDHKRMLEVIGESPAAFAALPVKLPLLLGLSSDIGFDIANVRKDLETIEAFAKEVQVSTPVVQSVRDSFENAVRHGFGAEDVAAIVRIRREGR